MKTLEQVVQHPIDERSHHGPITVTVDEAVIVAYGRERRPEWDLLKELETTEGLLSWGFDDMKRQKWWRVRPNSPAADLLRRFCARGQEPTERSWGNAGMLR